MQDILFIGVALLGASICLLAWVEVERVDKRYWIATPATLIAYGVLVSLQLVGGALIMVGLLVIVVKAIILPRVKAKQGGN